MSKTHDYFLSAEAARERCRRKGPHDNLPMTREEEIRASYDPSDDMTDAITDDRNDEDEDIPGVPE